MARKAKAKRTGRPACRKRDEAESRRDGIEDILRRMDAMPTIDARPEDEILGVDPRGVPSSAKWPDFAARSKKIFGDRVLSAVEDFLKYRHRDWEQ